MHIIPKKYFIKVSFIKYHTNFNGKLKQRDRSVQSIFKKLSLRFKNTVQNSFQLLRLNPYENFPDRTLRITCSADFYCHGHNLPAALFSCIARGQHRPTTFLVNFKIIVTEIAKNHFSSLWLCTKISRVNRMQ